MFAVPVPWDGKIRLNAIELAIQKFTQNCRRFR
jgi:hypothetical protein